MIDIRCWVEKFKSLSTEVKLYLVGLVPMTVWFLVLLLTKNTGWSTGILALSCSCMALGVIARLTPLFQRARRHPAVRRAAILFHLGVLLLVAIIARNVMTAATGLPGQDFALASSALVLPLYPFVWVWLVAFAAGIAAIGLQIYFLLAMFAQAIIPALSPWKGSGRTESLKRMAALGGARFVGMLTLFLVLNGALQYAESWQFEVERFARWVAYVGDYQAASRYPGIPENERFLMHANGVYSIARRVPGGDVSIDVHYWEGPGTEPKNQKSSDVACPAPAIGVPKVDAAPETLRKSTR
ncbi:hypothetical protein [Stenotrophomonas maltophilia]|uniref:hypothetical protein n=1 Tax=Stenotrophomonas maltophilia TaxID=40324 RepID=UPI0022F387E4|nr:hypothetical protein [Stenotrophomonas maltophilia]MDA5344367.1 hypothetical protein [Stenotrophomonas maltophilia]